MTERNRPLELLCERYARLFPSREYAGVELRPGKSSNARVGCLVTVPDVKSISAVKTSLALLPPPAK